MFRDRVEAGRHLADLVLAVPDLPRHGVVVLGLPRGGVPVAAEVAKALGAPLDVLVVRKLGVPFQSELAMGAIGEGDVRVENETVSGSASLIGVDIEAVARRERTNLSSQACRYRAVRTRLDLRGRCVVIVDDGLATGSSARAACLVARAQGAVRIVLAVSVAPRSAAAGLRDVCDDFVCVENPDHFYAVGEWYADFSPTSDEEVVELLRRGAQP